MKQGFASIPRYFLYGEGHFDAETDFLHVEPIRERSGKHDWTIRPHAHPDHAQLLFVASGGGWIRIEDERIVIVPPALLVIPGSVVHEIRFDPGTDGWVVTAALAFIQSVAATEHGLIETMRRPAAYPAVEGDLTAEELDATFQRLHREFVWRGPARRAAITACFLQILVDLHRKATLAYGQSASPTDRNYEIVLRYREMLERAFRTEKQLSFYADRLGVTIARLNLACKTRTGVTASSLLYERLAVEAKRYLLYTHMGVGEVGQALGFEDPAYFNRFFSKRVGRSPGAYRSEAQVGPA